MSRDPVGAALRQAAKCGLPYVHRDGPFVVLVLEGTHDHVSGRIEGRCMQRMCASAGVARAVAERALGCMAQFPWRDPLATAELYAEAALRHARRRRAA